MAENILERKSLRGFCRGVMVATYFRKVGQLDMKKTDR